LLSVYRALLKSGHPNTHLLMLPRGRHARIRRDSDEGRLFQNVAHAFYRAHDIPHNPEWADAGQEAFLRAQPKVSSAAKRP